MNKVFVDSFYYLALLNPRDNYHVCAQEWAKKLGGHFWTTEAVLLEVADALAAPGRRLLVIEMIERLKQDPSSTIIFNSPELFDRALALYTARRDKVGVSQTVFRSS